MKDQGRGGRKQEACSIPNEADHTALISEALLIAKQRKGLMAELRTALLTHAEEEALLLAAKLVGVEAEWLRIHPKKRG